MLRDGWLYTGDLARRDADGYYTIVDRKRDIIKTSGFLVFPAEVEEVLAGHPDVAEAAVVGVPDAERGEVVKALRGAARRPARRPGRAGGATASCTWASTSGRSISRSLRELPKNFLGKVLRRNSARRPRNKSALQTRPPATAPGAAWSRCTIE